VGPIESGRPIDRYSLVTRSFRQPGLGQKLFGMWFSITRQTECGNDISLYEGFFVTSYPVRKVAKFRRDLVKILICKSMLVKKLGSLYT